MGKLTGTKTNKTEYGTVNTFSISNARETDHGTLFTLVLNGVAINNCRVRETASGHEFIALPSYKGSDGNYYNHVYFRFSDEDTDRILDALTKELGI